ncbi:MAG: hypothetical protein QW767_01220 [Thermoprotei archaeon]
MALGHIFYTTESIIELVSAGLAIAVWYFSLRAFRFLGSVAMLFLSSAFLLFTLGLVVQAVYTLAANASIQRLRPVFFGEGYLLYSVLEFAGFVVLTYAYSISSKPTNLSLLLIPFLFRDLFAYGVQAVSTVLIVYILSRIYEEYKVSKMNYSKYIGVGFAFMLLQHAVRLVELYSQPLFLVSSVLQLAGFLCIFYAVWQVSSR